MNVIVITLDQSNEHQKSFNCLVPLEIQGKTADLLEPAQPATTRHGSIGATIKVDDKCYIVPSWAIKKLEPVPVTQFTI